jgi:hypothetical protein
MGAFIEDGSVAIVQLSGRSVYCDPHETKGQPTGARFETVYTASMRQSMAGE